MNKVIAVVGAASALVLPVFFQTGTAAASDDYAGMSYSKASEAASKAGQTVTIAARSGDIQQNGDCIVTRSQPAPFAASNGTHVTSVVLFYLDCNAGYATATKPGPSLGSTEGRAAKAAADKAAQASSGSGSSDGG